MPEEENLEEEANAIEASEGDTVDNESPQEENSQEETADEDDSFSDEGEFSEDSNPSSEGDFSNDEESSDFNDDGLEGDDGFSDGFGDMPEDGMSDDMGMMMDGGGDDKTSMISAFATFELSLMGPNIPYDRYVLEDKEVFIGRDSKKCQIVLKDGEVSSQHAVIRRGVLGYTLEDLNSSNGTLFEGKRINKIELLEGNEFIIGSTTFTVKVSSEMIDNEAETLMPVDQDQEIEVEEIVEEEVDFNDGGVEGEGFDDDFTAPETEEKPKSLVGKWKNLPPKKKLIYGVVGLALLFMLLDDSDTSKKKKKGDPKKNNYALNSKSKEKPDSKAKPGQTPTPQKKLTKEEQEQIEGFYQIAKAKLRQAKYQEALANIAMIEQIDPKYKETLQMKLLAEEELKKLEEFNLRQKEEEERRVRQAKIKELVDKAREATDNHQVELAESLFAKIYSLDPENLDVSQMKLELDAWKKEQERKALEKVQKEADRKRMVDALSPGKTHYLKEEWYAAITRLEEFLRKPNMDEDLIKEATDMLQESKRRLEMNINPLMGRARSLREGQDLKGAYETYKQVLKFNPTFNEALNEMSYIQDVLKKRARKKYREALISESLSLFEDAREKFQEVQQISPSDGEYYQKASEKLREYWE